jgi:hypothetical protein
MRRTAALLAVGTLLAMLAMAQMAGASHVRPKGATPLRDSLVIAQRSCAAPGTTTHGVPLAFPSCSPPGQTSNFLTVGTPDANGAGANMVGYAKLTQLAADVAIEAQSTDVRCLPATAASVCPFANAADGPDYIGELQLEVGLRITDHFNAPNNNTPATTVDFIFPVKVPCGNTSGNTAIGSLCTITTSMNSVVPGSAPANKRTTYQIPQRTSPGGIQVYDGGPSGMAGATNATLFLEPGIWLP